MTPLSTLRIVASCVPLLFAPAATSNVASWQKSLQPHYDVVILGTGLKESLLAGLLSQHGKLVLQLEQSDTLGGDARSLDLQELADATEGPGAVLSEQRVGPASDYRIERVPKARCRCSALSCMHAMVRASQTTVCMCMSCAPRSW